MFSEFPDSRSPCSAEQCLLLRLFSASNFFSDFSGEGMQFLSWTHFLIYIQMSATFPTATISSPLICLLIRPARLFFLPMPSPISHFFDSVYNAILPWLCKTFAYTGKFDTQGVAGIIIIIIIIITNIIVAIIKVIFVGIERKQETSVRTQCLCAFR